jgi:hypothetical protein
LFVSSSFAKPKYVDNKGNVKDFSCEDPSGGGLWSKSKCMEKCKDAHPGRCFNGANGKIQYRTGPVAKKLNAKIKK